MKGFKDISIRSKLIFIQSATAFIAVLLCCAFFVFEEIKTFKASAVRKMYSVARIAGDNSVSPLLFMDADAATAILQSLSKEPDIVDAVLLDKTGKVFARYTREGTPFIPLPEFGTTDTLSSIFSKEKLIVSYKIFQETELLGNVIIRVEMSDLNKIIASYIRAAVLVLLASILAAMLISGFLQRTITGRLLSLVSKTKEVADTGSYTSRVPVEARDEIGVLSEEFNMMLERIEKMENSLVEANVALDKRVKERTKELETVNSQLESNVRQLAEREEQVNLIIRNAPDPVVVINDKGIITRWNTEAEKTFGWKADEVVGKYLHEIIIPERYREAHTMGLARFRQTGEGRVLNKRIELPALRKDGTEAEMELTISPTKVKDEYVFIAFLRDITERKKMEAELKRTNAFLDTVLENIPNMIFVKDAKELRFVLFNKAGEKLLGYNRKDLIGRNDYDFFPEEQADFFTRKDRSVLNKKALHDIPEEPIDTRYGRRWLHTQKVPVVDEKGEPVYLLGISEDITERKETEERIRQLNQELEQKIAQLETVNKELDAFSYSISHDLRAPLRAIHGYTKILMEDYSVKLDEDARQMMTSIMTNAKKMGQLIDDLLAFSRLGKKEVQKTTVDMTTLAKSTVDELKNSSPGFRGKITIQPIPPAQADYSLMRQVFANLISNAIKYSQPSEHPEIQIGSLTETNETIYFVKDNGVGFDMQFYDKLFGVFQRLHSEEEFEGTGVGLAIVKRIINRHGGRVWAEAEKGKGATFYFTLEEKSKAE